MLAVTLLMLAQLTHASPNYPPVLEEEAGSPCTPTCTVCHQTQAGGGGTVVQPFGEALVDRGLTGGGDLERLREVLAEAAADGQDVSGDGTEDLDLLADGVDPNPDGAPFCEVEQPVYGCLSHTGAAPAAGLTLLALLVAMGRRREGLDPRADGA